ncbi:DUF4242 domain-containing protein [Novosphingobium naphthalenivorans]|uniref:DUF4242 domain-containing protein n=1 Tax=Novosphingobium naphthalenivorans TaxID=273168 RepID=UPI00082DEF78|nr:DUF4242 domain-containing protein [Novosphingobium naphthalenivorans]
MKMFIDTHDKDHGTFPAGISRLEFAAFYKSYLEACEAEGVVSMRIHVGLDEGRAFCVNLAPDAGAVRRAHERVGLAFDSITEVTDASAFDLFSQTVPA